MGSVWLSCFRFKVFLTGLVVVVVVTVGIILGLTVELRIAVGGESIRLFLWGYFNGYQGLRD